jgi:hypothetical protein
MSSLSSSLPSPTRDNFSNVDFKTATADVSKKAMREEVNHLVNTVEDLIEKHVGLCLLLLWWIIRSCGSSAAIRRGNEVLPKALRALSLGACKEHASVSVVPLRKPVI